RSEAGGAFSRNRAEIESSANQAKQAGRSVVDQNRAKVESAATQVASAWDQAGRQMTPAYRDAKARALQGVQGASYDGPTSFAAGLSGEAQEYGSQLGSDSGFKAVLNALYNRSAGGRMGTGQLSL